MANRGLQDNLVSGAKANSLPSDVESEKAILSLCLKNTTVLNDIIGKRISKDDFFDIRNKLIYEAITDLYLSSENIDKFTVCDKLNTTGNLSRAGGNTYVMSLTDVFSQASNISNYISIVREKSILRQLSNSFNELNSMALSNAEASNDIVDLAVGRLTAMREAPDGIGFESLSIILQNNLNQIHAITSGKLEVDSIRTGFTGLDYMLGGLKPGALYVLAARPGMGKTSLAINMATNIAEFYHQNVDIFTLEMSKSEIGNKILASKSRTSSRDLQRAKISKEQELKLANVYNQLSGLPIYIDDNSNVNPVTMSSNCKKLKAEGRLGLVIVDYLQLMTMPGKGNNYSRQQEISDISRSLKLLAKDLQVPILALSQLSRGTEKREDKTPMLSDLRDSGAIEQDADVVLFIDRKDYYDKNSAENSSQLSGDECYDARIIVAKNRHGETGTVTVKWIPSRTLFVDEERTSDPVEVRPKESAYTRKTTAGAAASDYKFDQEPEDLPFSVEDEPPMPPEPYEPNVPDMPEAPIAPDFEDAAPSQENDDFFGEDTNMDFPEGMI